MPNFLSLVWRHSVHFATFPILQFSKRYTPGTSPTIFIGSHPNFMGTLLTIGQCRLLLCLAMGQVLQNVWHFEILTLASMGKPKMWNVSKTADCRAKWIIDSRAKGKWWHFDIFLNTGPYAAGNFKVLILPQFHWSHPNFITILVTMINLNAS